MRLKELLEYSAEEAGRIHLKVLESGEDFDLPFKFGGSTPSDDCTIADVLSEERLREIFRIELPGFDFIGEENGGGYSGDRKVVFADPLDGTRHFRNYKETGYAEFGTAIGVYESGLCIGGVVRNSVSGRTYVATKEDGFDVFGQEEIIPDGVIYIAHHRGLYDLVKEEFKGHRVMTHQSSAMNRVRVHEGRWAGFFHPALARHDIAPDPIFGRCTGTVVTDHNGDSYDNIDEEYETGKYRMAEQEVDPEIKKRIMYSNPIMVAQPDIAEKLLWCIGRFKEEFEKIKKPY